MRLPVALCERAAGWAGNVHIDRVRGRAGLACVIGVIHREVGCGVGEGVRPAVCERTDDQGEGKRVRRGEGADGGIGTDHTEGRVVGGIQGCAVVIRDGDSLVDELHRGAGIEDDGRRPGVVDVGERRRRGVSPRGAVRQVRGIGAGC